MHGILPRWFAIPKSLAVRATDRERSPFAIVEFPTVVPEFKFVQITVKVLAADVVIDAVQPALQDREYAFDRIGGSVIAHPLASRVVDAPVTTFLLAADHWVAAPFISHDLG